MPKKIKNLSISAYKKRIKELEWDVKVARYSCQLIEKLHDVNEFHYSVVERENRLLKKELRQLKSKKGEK